MAQRANSEWRQGYGLIALAVGLLVLVAIILLAPMCAGTIIDPVAETPTPGVTATMMPTSTQASVSVPTATQTEEPEHLPTALPTATMTPTATTTSMPTAIPTRDMATPAVERG